MKHDFYRNAAIFAVVIVLFIFFIDVSRAEETGIPVATPVILAKPVKNHDGLGRFLGKTMKMVSHKGAGILPKLSQPKTSADKGAPDPVEPKLFEPKSKESPIRTARLFKIQFNPAVAVPVN